METLSLAKPESPSASPAPLATATFPYPLPIGDQLPDPRTVWAVQRAILETTHAKSQRRGGKLRRRWDLFESFLKVVGLGLSATGLMTLGRRKALALELTKLELAFPNLPPRFDGYRILYLSDLHLDFLPGTDQAIIEAIQRIETPVDLALFGGDYRTPVDRGHRHILPALYRVTNAIDARDGQLAVLGNHDSVYMVPDLERLGLRVLANETLTLRRGEDALYLTGLDDVHYFYTDLATQALEASPEGFKIALVHSAELHDVALQNGYSLYLAGHTHGGQVCLPGGLPLITHHTAGRRRARGLWRDGSLVGYTSRGAGTAGLPVRYFCPGEIVLLTLRRSPALAR